jgi:hypothetical protein
VLGFWERFAVWKSKKDFVRPQEEQQLGEVMWAEERMRQPGVEEVEEDHPVELEQ